MSCHEVVTVGLYSTKGGWTSRSRGETSLGATNGSIADLISRLGTPPKSSVHQSNGAAIPLSPITIFASWLASLPRPLLPGTGKRLFRVLFPHEGARRRYGFKETRLSAALESALGVRLAGWDSVARTAGAGCLGTVVQRAMTQRVRQMKCRLTLSDISRGALKSDAIRSG